MPSEITLQEVVPDGEQYSFTHEIYQEYYAAEFLHQIRK